MAAVLAWTLAIAGDPARAAAPPEPAAHGTHWLTLKNGARALLVPDPRATAVSVGLWLDAGVRYEKAGTVGLSHLVEHLSARGIDPGGDAAVRRRIEALGGNAASFTSDDFTCFLDAVPPGALGTVLDLEARRFAVKPTQAMLDQDRTAVRDENRVRAQLNPLDRVLQELYTTAFPSHPYRFPATGIDEDLARITLKDCQDYLRSRYRADQLRITVVGAFDPGEAEGLIRRAFEPIAGRGDTRASAPAKPPESGVERRRTVAGDVAVPIVAVGWSAPADAGDAVALELMSAVLSGGSSSRLPLRVVGDQQACVFARASRDRQRDVTMFWAVAALRPGADSAAVEKNLISEIEGLAREPIPGGELDGARKQLEVALLLARESAADRGRALGMAEMIAGDYRDAARELERLRTLTPADVQQVAARTLTTARRTVVWLRAGSGGTGGGR